MSKISAIFSQRIRSVLDLVECTNKSSVLIIQQFPTSRDTLSKFPKVRESISNILAFIELGSCEDLDEVISLTDGVFDSIVMDGDIKLPISAALIHLAKERIQKSKLFFYSDINTWADSALQFILQQEKGLYGKRVLLTGEGLLHDALLNRMQLLGVEWVTIHDDSIDVLIGVALKCHSANDAILERVVDGGTLYDIGIGNFTSNLIEMACSKGHPVYRIDIRAGISSAVINILETDYLIHKVMGKVKIKNIELVAGGIMGSKNAIIIDDINHPAHILGVADGEGNIKIEVEKMDYENIQFVERLIQTGKNTILEKI